MFLLQAPFPAPQTTILLPSPDTGNRNNLASTVQTLRSMNGTLYTYIKSKRGRKVYSWDFVTSVHKADETKTFMDRYAGSLVLATDHNGEQFVGYMTLNPFELSGVGRAGGWPGNEAYGFTVQLEERVL